MEISYVREMRKNYLVVEARRDFLGYEARMLAANPVQGLLPMKVRYMDGSASYYYDITSRQPLGRLLESRQITVEEICGLIRQIHGALRRMEEFFLGDGGILLEPEYIYMEPEAFQAGLCFVPGAEENFQEGLSRLLQYLLRHVDHRDRKAVILAYSLYQESLKENYSLEDLLRLMEGEEKKTAGARKLEMETELETGRRLEELGIQKDAEGGENGLPDRQKPAKEEKKKTAGSMAAVRPAIPWRQGIAAGLGILILPGIVWIFRGGTFLRTHVIEIAAVQAGLLLIAVLRILWKARPSKAGDFRGGRSPYEEVDLPEEPFPVREEAQSEEKEEIFQTVLLKEEADPNMHRLEGVSPETEDIVIPYYPFVIGKHRELADYVLNRDTVSRLHLRCDRDGDSCTITDLNSTNGTMVRGILLDANETVEVKSGDAVVIADIPYVWR